MKLFVLVTLVFCVSCSHSYYIVRHAEKETSSANMMSNDVPLTEAGKRRAEEIKNILAAKKIEAVYATNTIRTRSTAQPTADYFHLSIQLYGPRPDSAFFAALKVSKRNTLIVGHSNTVDDIVNGLCGEKKVAGDLADDEYNKLFVVKFKGHKVFFNEKRIFPPDRIADPKF